MMFSMVFAMIAMSGESARRIVEILTEKSTLHDPDDPVFEVKDGSIDFDHVDFKYSPTAEKNVLEDIDLHIKSGETIGIIGGTGSSKTSLVNLLSRLYDVTEGSVKVGGVDVRAYDLTALRNQVAVVLQRTSSSRAPSKKISVGAIPTRRTKSSSKRANLRRRTTSSRASPINMIPTSNRAVPTSRAGRSSACASRAPSSKSPRSSSSTTRRVPSIPTPTRSSARHSANISPRRPRSSSRSVSPRWRTPTASSSWRVERSTPSARTKNSSRPIPSMRKSITLR